MQTLKVSAYAGLLISLPLILFQVYAFVLPAFSPREKQVAFPAMLGIPFLFIGGVVFGYFTVVPRAIEFLQNFNTDAFDVLIQAQPYYKFVLMLLMAMGLLFQIPVAIVAVTRVGIVSTSQLAHNRRYAILVIAVLAMLLPGQDPVTMSMMMAPMYVLFEALYPVVLAAGSARCARRRRGGGLRIVVLLGARARHPRSGLVRTTPMLFDLRSGARRRTVKVVYLGLALLMFVGFVGFGIGSSGLVGGIGDAITGNGSSGGGDNAAVERLTTQVQTADAKAKAAPTDPAAWAALAQARVRLADVGDNLDSDDRRLHRRGPPPAHRRRRRVGQVRRARARRRPTSASPARWPRPSSRIEQPPTRPSAPKRS